MRDFRREALRLLRQPRRGLGRSLYARQGRPVGEHRDRRPRYLPVWPHPGFVEGGVSEAWTDYEVTAIEVHKFLDVLENLHEMGDEVALFRRADGDFITVPPAPLLEDLQAGLDEVE